MDAHLLSEPVLVTRLDRPGTMGPLCAAVAGLALGPATALAHPGVALRPHELWGAWSWSPAPIVGLIALAALYGRGLLRLWRHGVGRGVARWEAMCFAGGWLVLAFAVVSPLHRLGGALLTAHMVQHELLMVVAAPLLVLGRPLAPVLWALPPTTRRSLGRLGWRRSTRSCWALLSRPSVAWTLQAIAIVTWHLPALYQRSILSEAAHALQHTSFLATALLFWWALLRGAGSRGRAGASVLYLFGTAVYTGGLGALLTIAPRLWYPVYVGRTAPWGLTPLEDQQLAGLVMWMPGALGYLAGALALGGAWLREAERRVLRWEALRSALPLLLVVAVGGLAACRDGPALSRQEAFQLTGGDPERGRHAIRSYGCGACHTIRGVPGAKAGVGPPLSGIGGRAYIAGVLTNTPDNLVLWIESPQRVDSLTAMPDLGVTRSDASDIASYLYTLR